MLRLAKFVKNEYFLLLLILTGAFVVRLYKIGNPIADWHSWRQADTSSVSRIYKDEGIDLLAPRYYDISKIQTGALNFKSLRLVEFPIYNALHATFASSISFCPQVAVPENPLLRKIYFYFFPVNVDIARHGTPCFEIAGRLVSVSIALVSTVFLYLIGRKLYSRSVGLIAAFLFAFIPYNIYFSRVILPDPMGVMFALVGLYFFIRSIYDDNKWFLYISGFAFAGSLLIKPFNIFYLLPVIYLSFRKFGKELLIPGSVLIRHLIFAFIVVAPLSIWRIWINKYPNGIPHFEWAFNGDKIRFQPAFWYWLFGERIGKLILGVWGIIPFYLGLTRVRKNLLHHFWILGILLHLIIVATANVRHDYYQIMLVPPLALTVAIGVVSAKDKLEKVLLTACIVLSMFIGAFQVKEFYLINHPELIVAGDAVKRLVPQDALIIAPYNGDTAFLYQTGRFGWPVVDEPFAKMISRGARFFVAVNFADPDVAYVEKNFRVLERTDQYIISDLLLRPR